jgi:hypothetical protein
MPCAFVGWVEFLDRIVVYDRGPSRGTKPNTPGSSSKGCGRATPRFVGFRSLHVLQSYSGTHGELNATYKSASHF